MGHRLVRDARRDDCLTLSRFWLRDGLPKKCASRIIGIMLREPEIVAEIEQRTKSLKDPDEDEPKDYRDANRPQLCPRGK